MRKSGGGGWIRRELLIPMRVLLVPNFNFTKYIALKESKLSICSVSCWGGFCYHQLGLEFLSPTINLYFSQADFNKFMKNLDYYISLPVEFAEMQYEKYNEKNYFPVGLIGDIRLHFNHYANFEYAKECWEKRKKRINKNNMLVVSFTSSEDIAIEFDSLPYQHKIIFTSFETDLKSSFYLKFNPDDYKSYGMSVNATASGRRNLIDLIALCNHEDDYIRMY